MKKLFVIATVIFTAYSSAQAESVLFTQPQIHNYPVAASHDRFVLANICRHLFNDFDSENVVATFQDRDPCVAGTKAVAGSEYQKERYIETIVCTEGSQIIAAIECNR